MNRTKLDILMVRQLVERFIRDLYEGNDKFL